MMMKLYALKDRLLNYYLQPFVGHDDVSVMASLAETINGDVQHALTKSPHHFELHQLATINTETGAVFQVEAVKEFVCDCSTLVRGRFRENGEYGTEKGPSASPGGRGAPTVRDLAPGARTGAAAGSAPTTDIRAPESRQESDGVPGCSNR